MVDQIILVADEMGNHTGEYIDKEVAHTGRGERHLAISVLLGNDKGQVLLQKRKHKVHNDIWDLTGSTHHLHRKDGSNETSEEATYRCLKRECGITKRIPLKILGGINYFAPVGEFCENEHDIILTGEYNGKIKPNKDVAYAYKWVDKNTFLADIDKNPKKYAPWAVKGARLIERSSDSIFLTDLNRFQEKFLKFSKAYFAKKRREVNKYPKLVSTLWQNIEDFGLGGKAMRPYLVYLGYKISGGKRINDVLPIAFAIELVHNFLLIHDDIIDKSDIRRNKPTLHKRYEEDFGSHYGLSQAIVAGDVAFFEAVKIINETNLDSRITRQIVIRLCNFLSETGYGELLDVLYSYTKSKVSDVWEVTELKTARYSFVGPMQIGAIIAGASERKLDLLEKYATQVGIAFQLQDDILGVFGNEKVLGKSVLSDMHEGKNTILYLKTKEKARGADLRALERIWGNTKSGNSDLEKATYLMKKLGAYDWCVSEMKKLVKEAQKIVSKISTEVEIKLILNSAADFVINRGK